MGPFDLNRQYQRMESIQALLSQPNLPTQTREMWTRILNGISLDEDSYNMRVMWTYRNHTREIISYE